MVYLGTGKSTILPDDKFDTAMKLFVGHLDQMVDNDPELSDIHEAFETYCMMKYSNAEPNRSERGGRKSDLGIDFYSVNSPDYHVGQCKIPERSWLEANPEKAKSFGQQAISDAQDALEYLLGRSSLKGNDRVRRP